MRRIYVASSWRNPTQPDVVATLRAAGHEVHNLRNPAPESSVWAPDLPVPDRKLDWMGLGDFHNALSFCKRATSSSLLQELRPKALYAK